MATVLMAWELGGGLGHVKRLIDLAGPIAAQGHKVTFALRNIFEPAALFDDLPHAYLQAPFFMRRARSNDRPFRAASYADILAVCGFAETKDLLPMVTAWQSLLDLTQPQLIVADHSPTVCLAAYSETPVVNVGNGFVIPPTDDQFFPPLPTNAEPFASQEQLLEVVQRVQQQRGCPVPADLPRFLGATERFVVTWPELDPYCAVRRDKVWGPCANFPPPEPPPTQPRFFAYLAAEFPGVQRVLQSLSRAGFEGEAFIRDASPELRKQLQTDGVRVHEKPAPISATLAGCSLIIHHAGLGTAEAALAAGRVQLMLPMHLEQELTSRVIEELGVGKGFSGRVLMSEITATAKQLVTADWQQRALYMADQLHARRPGDVVEHVANRCLDYLDRD